ASREAPEPAVPAHERRARNDGRRGRRPHGGARLGCHALRRLAADRHAGDPVGHTADRHAGRARLARVPEQRRRAHRGRRLRHRRRGPRPDRRRADPPPERELRRRRPRGTGAVAGGQRLAHLLASARRLRPRRRMRGRTGGGRRVGLRLRRAGPGAARRGTGRTAAAARSRGRQADRPRPGGPPLPRPSGIGPGDRRLRAPARRGLRPRCPPGPSRRRGLRPRPRHEREARRPRASRGRWSADPARRAPPRRRHGRLEVGQRWHRRDGRPDARRGRGTPPAHRSL
ncbi:MAG: hypothetical protein AVDCRST_MAG38-2741, partial [uncultured Solirubrobacteraceae bacterium]